MPRAWRKVYTFLALSIVSPQRILEYYYTSMSDFDAGLLSSLLAPRSGVKRPRFHSDVDLSSIRHALVLANSIEGDRGKDAIAPLETTQGSVSRRQRSTY